MEEWPQAVVVERREGRSGELVLRRRGEQWEVVLDGTFLIASVNEASSRALVRAALPFLPDRPLDVLIGGLGMGYALDEALGLAPPARVTVAEFEPVVVEWFERYFGERASRLRRDARSQVVVADVADVLRDSPAAFDLIALDTDNGPSGWCAARTPTSTTSPGSSTVRRALRPGGVAVLWSPEPYDWFERRLLRVFASVTTSEAHDEVQGRRLAYTMYVCRGGMCVPTVRAPMRAGRGAVSARGRLGKNTAEAAAPARPGHGGGGMALTWDDPEDIAFELVRDAPRHRSSRPQLRRPARDGRRPAGVRGRSRRGQRDQARSDRPGLE